MKKSLLASLLLTAAISAHGAVIFNGSTDTVYKATTDNTNVALGSSAGTYTLTNNSASGQGAYVFGNFSATALSNVGDSLTLSFTVQNMPASTTPLYFSIGGSRGVSLTTSDDTYNGFERSYAGFRITNSVGSAAVDSRAWNGGPAGNTTADRIILTGATTTSLGASATGIGVDRFDAGRTATFTLNITRQTTSFDIGGSISVVGGSGIQNYTTYGFTPSGSYFQLTDSFTSIAIGLASGTNSDLDASAMLTLSGITVDYVTVGIPEPSTYGVLAGVLALGIVMVRRRRA